MKPCVFTGSAVAIVTPFCGDGVDLEAFDRLIERQIQGGTDAIVVCGTTGEAATLKSSQGISVYCWRQISHRKSITRRWDQTTGNWAVCWPGRFVQIMEKVCREKG